ncbi:helix-turn-helix transcriptional regulator [Parapedobacter tibetensis]|uniref:helix-turn-helix transcriptional regulator n=1 Tax=Parapedobacter tibetensis TaxID=2972951 RepID=UPI00214DEEA4|nr:hypothetical protein [Parapedobacter tibetensis]
MKGNKIENICSDLIEKAIRRLIEIREKLSIKIPRLAKASPLSRSTLERLEKREVTPSLESIFSLILFYGFTLPDFFDFDEPLPTAEKLKRRMKAFHKKTGSDAYEKVFTRPKLNDLIPEELITSGFFDDYHTVAEVADFCKEEYGYTYGNATNTLDNAVKKGWLVLDDRVKPKKYRKK